MDPLNVTQAVVDYSALTCWQDVAFTVPERVGPVGRDSPFKTLPEVNRKVYLWEGDVTNIRVDAIINSTNEAMSDRNATSESIANKGGPALQTAIKKLRGCKTGEAKITEGGGLVATWVIHAVGPRYNVKYRTAAESALYNCYRNALLLMMDHQLKSIAFVPINSMRRGYPAAAGAHIALRTVKRFLEEFHSQMNAVVFVVSGEDAEVYREIMPMYFPRNKAEEQWAADKLPVDTGNAKTGEPVIEERKIRISEAPIPGFNADSSESDTHDGPSMVSEVSETGRAFLAMEAHPDDRRGLTKKPNADAPAQESECSIM